MILLQREIRALRNVKRARVTASFFRMGKGQYGEGDVFLGLTVPQSRRIARQYGALPLSLLEVLLHSRYHEERLIGLLILGDQFQSGNEKTQKEIFDFYLAHLDRVNNWDLVDLSAEKIVGAYLFGRSTAPFRRLIVSKNLWERRVAMVASWWFIRNGDVSLTFHLAKQLLNDPEDLLHKAAGWMLRETGKRGSKRALRLFLKQYAGRMPRTMLRYAIEHFSETERKKWLFTTRKRKIA